MSDEIKIESGIQIPSRHKQTFKYPWYEMKIGDSFLAPIGINKIQSAKTYAQMKTGFKFACRAVEGGTRIWRIE